MMNYVEHEVRTVLLGGAFVVLLLAASDFGWNGVGVVLIWQQSSRTRSGILMKKSVQ